MDSRGNPDRILERELPRRGLSLKELLFAAILAVHAVVFARLYLRRGRLRFDLLFAGGFLLLTIFYAGRSWLSLAGIEPEPTYLQ